MANTLYVRTLNHGQSEVWLGDENTDAASRRTLATNESRNIVERLCLHAFEASYKDWHVQLGRVVSLETNNVPNLAKELKLT